MVGVYIFHIIGMDLYKIGWSRDISRRLEELRVDTGGDDPDLVAGSGRTRADLTRRELAHGNDPRAQREQAIRPFHRGTNRGR